YLPAGKRSWVLKKLIGIDLLRFANMGSAGEVCRKLRRRGVVALQGSPKRVEGIGSHCFSRFGRDLICLFSAPLLVPLFRQILLWIGPAFEIACRKSENPSGVFKT